MKPARFTYHAPDSLAAALDLLARLGDDAKLIAGGQSLVPAMNMRLAQPEHLVDLNGIGDLAGIAVEGDRLVVGAMTRHADIETDPVVAQHHPMLAEVARHIGHFAIRQRGTIGGSLAHAEPAAQWPMVARLLDAKIEITGPDGARVAVAEDFLVSVFTTDLTENEILTRVFLPLPAAGQGWGFRFFSRRAGDFAVVLAGALLRLEGGRVQSLALALGGVDAVPLRLTALETESVGAEATVDWATALGEKAAAAIDPAGDFHADADYRRDLIRVLVARALDDAIGRAG